MAGTAVACMVLGWFTFAKHAFGLDPEDFEVWYVDRVDKRFVRLKVAGASGLDPDVDFTVPGWQDVPEAWPPRGEPFDAPQEKVETVFLEGKEASDFTMKWNEWHGGAIRTTPPGFFGK
jgi:hypothetical protein